MEGEDQFESHIVQSWRQNVAAWTDAVRSGKIESRRSVTDRAILDSVFSEAFASAVDIGCGEGWLVRALQRSNIEVVGLDAVPEFIESAQHKGPGDYRCIDYNDLAQNGLGQRFDLAVCNFSLLGKDSVATLVSSIPQLLRPGGRFIVQTLNPHSAAGNDYRDGWRVGSWEGFGEEFVNPAPWYFRTLESWLALFQESSWAVSSIAEPSYPDDGLPVSIIFSTKVDSD